MVRQAKVGREQFRQELWMVVYNRSAWLLYHECFKYDGREGGREGGIEGGREGWSICKFNYNGSRMQTQPAFNAQGGYSASGGAYIHRMFSDPIQHRREVGQSFSLLSDPVLVC